jgi:hypothetical protein
VNKRKRFVGVQFLDVVRQGKFTVAFGTYSDSEVGRINFAGVSARNPEDRKDNAQRGRTFAKSRAFRDLAKKIDKKEWSSLSKSPIVKVVAKLSEEEIAEKRAAGAAIRAEREAKRHAESIDCQPKDKKDSKRSSKAGKGTRKAA